jgi:hypothetical protein
MGKSYWFECGRCGYRAKVAGRADEGLHVSVQTILCQDCRELYDAVTRLRILNDSRPAAHDSMDQAELDEKQSKRAPSFQWALNRLRYTGEKVSDWVNFPVRCPVSALHKVRPWKDPDKCPRCGVYLEKPAVAYRVWE